MFLAWLIGLCMMVAAGGIFYYYHVNYGIPYEKFRFENSNEFGILAPKDWEEYQNFNKIEIKAQIEGALLGKPIAYMFVIGMILFTIPTLKFLFKI
ncbi:hypothetical protein [Methylobacterium indicum]|uniref:Uncharacterized protein n=1 Tax=Methylobacterium indicum TaxID=1775910 RepID=A0A8H8X187_9HYPH|nr:hypothetical protein [Methylobacterium indicum]BCM88027.1 hypothetical protein mvi_64880 [Methylobacterium indicum]